MFPTMKVRSSIFKNLFLASTLALLPCTPYSYSIAAPVYSSGIQWLSWEQATALHKKNPKKIVVDIYTDWCGWCKRMDQNTFGDPVIAQYVNEHYYAIKFNAEQRDDILFRGKTYKFVPSGKRGYHELAAAITNGRLSYPNTVFLNEGLEVIQAIPGYKEPADFEMILTYFAKNKHLETPWETYQRNYQPLPKNP